MTAHVLHQAIAEYQVVVAEAARARICPHDFHPWLVRIVCGIEIDKRDLAGTQAQGTPRSSGPAQVEDAHIRKARKATLEFFVATLSKLVRKGSGVVRIDEPGKRFG
jgi:hypothetical protein